MIRLPVMPDESGLLPPEITSALRRLARGPRSEFHGGVARLCRQHAEHAAIEAGDAVRRAWLYPRAARNPKRNANSSTTASTVRPAVSTITSA